MAKASDKRKGRGRSRILGCVGPSDTGAPDPGHADQVGFVDARVGDGVTEATDLYKQALRKAGLQDHDQSDDCWSWDACPFCYKHPLRSI